MSSSGGDGAFSNSTKYMNREEFRIYLEETGLMEALTHSFLALHEETAQPADTIKFVANKLGGCVEKQPTIDLLNIENNKLKYKVEELERQVVDLRGQINRMHRQTSFIPTTDLNDNNNSNNKNKTPQTSGAVKSNSNAGKKESNGESSSKK